jgi:hypothetical protein
MREVQSEALLCEGTIKEAGKNVIYDENFT